MIFLAIYSKKNFTFLQYKDQLFIFIGHVNLSLKVKIKRNLDSKREGVIFMRFHVKFTLGVMKVLRGFLVMMFVDQLFKIFVERSQYIQCWGNSKIQKIIN
jgi:hypothetical protein